MARQGGFLGIRGTVGGMTFGKNGVIRVATPPNKEKFATDSSMARTRENASEFGRAAKDGKLLRQALRSVLQGAADAHMVPRLVQKLRAMEGLDTTHPRGERQVLKAYAAALVGFDFNAHAPLSTTLAAPYDVSVSAAGLVTVTIASLTPRVELAAPAGATHYGLELGVAVVDFEAMKARSVPASEPAPAVLDGVPVAGVTLTADAGGAPKPTEIVVVAFGVRFYQQLNGQLYPLQNEAAHPLAVVYAG